MHTSQCSSFHALHYSVPLSAHSPMCCSQSRWSSSLYGDVASRTLYNVLRAAHHLDGFCPSPEGTIQSLPVLIDLTYHFRAGSARLQHWAATPTVVREARSWNGNAGWLSKRKCIVAVVVPLQQRGDTFQSTSQVCPFPAWTFALIICWATMHFLTEIVTNFVDIGGADADVIDGPGTKDEKEIRVVGLGGWLFGRGGLWLWQDVSALQRRCTSASIRPTKEHIAELVWYRYSGACMVTALRSAKWLRACWSGTGMDKNGDRRAKWRGWNSAQLASEGCRWTFDVHRRIQQIKSTFQFYSGLWKFHFSMISTNLNWRFANKFQLLLNQEQDKFQDFLRN